MLDLPCSPHLDLHHTFTPHNESLGSKQASSSFASVAPDLLALAWEVLFDSGMDSELRLQSEDHHRIFERYSCSPGQEMAFFISFIRSWVAAF